jgi:hypothetical protein
MSKGREALGNSSAGLEVQGCVEGVGKREESLDSFLVVYCDSLE